MNLTAPFLLMRAVVATMKAQQYGRIVNISSTAGRMVSTLAGAHYTASKAYPVPRLGTAREVADVICFSASEAAGYITAPRSTSTAATS